MNIRIERLRGEVASDREALADHLERLARIDLSASAADEGGLALAAWELHHAYSAVESILERVARTIEGSVPDGPDWHKALLDNASIAIPNVRPPLLSRQVGHALHDLRSFRHFVRHAYAIRLDRDRLVDLQGRAARLRSGLDSDLQRLDGWLSEVAGAD